MRHCAKITDNIRIVFDNELLVAFRKKRKRVLFHKTEKDKLSTESTLLFHTVL